MAQVLSISDIVHQIKDLLEGEFRNIAVEGEISNLSPSSAGHWYFTLSDENSSLSCALFKMDAFRNPLIRKLKNGDKIIVNGPISVYGKRGTFQLLAKRVFPAGKGDLSVQFQMLKDKLSREGLFDPEYKKPIPKFPKKIAVVTALKGAALQDFLKVMERRSLWYHISIIPAVVQGDASANSLIKAIDIAHKKEDFDVIVLTRGGGSLEDLWSFNNEKLARRIFASDIPVISAVGHEVDFTLSDFVADMRLETPTAAAAFLSQSHTDLYQKLDFMVHRLKSWLQETNATLLKRIQRVHPKYMLDIIRSQIYQAKNRLQRSSIKGRLYDLTNIHEYQQYSDELYNRLTNATQRTLEQRSNRIETAQQILKSLNPKNVLGRGYTYLESDSQEVITNVKKFNKIKDTSILTIHFSDGSGRVKKDV
jgi:exodeoxyribonuclease VII large subunit